MNWETVLAAIVTAVCALIGTYVSNKKQAALMAYRIEMLEKKVDKHNNLVERMYKCEEAIMILKAQKEDDAK